MAKTVLLEFEDGDEYDADMLVESIHEYNHAIMIQASDDTFRKVHPIIAGVYTNIIAIEGKSVD